MPELKTDLARRSITSVVYNSAASVSRVLILFVRSIMLARLLPVETFGIYAGALALVSLTVSAAAFGMGGAFLHHCEETEDTERAAAVHFTLKLILTSLWAITMIIIAIVLGGSTQVALLLLIAAIGVAQLTQTPELILVRRVEHRRLALMQFLKALLTTAVAITLAIRGATLWALLSTDIVATLILVAGFYIFKPVWRPKLAFDRDLVRYFLRFGAANFSGVVVQAALERLPVLWSRFFLGATLTGFYSRAQTFASYPGIILADPVNRVAAGAYAELKGQRTQLSKAFFRSNALLVRTGFLLGGGLIISAPELIEILLGEKWMPMLPAFRLMILYTLLNPIKGTLSSLFVAIGRPADIARFRLVQLFVLLTGLVILTGRFDITGVAIAVNISVAVGITIFLVMARRHVELSIWRLFAGPGAALIAGMLTTFAVLGTGWFSQGLVDSLLAKIFVFAPIYAIVLWLIERNELKRMLTSLLSSRGQ